MQKLLKPSANLLVLILSLSLTNCGSMHISDTPIMVRLPATRQCFEVKVLSGAERLYPPKQCDAMAERAILLTSEAWKMLRTDIQKNCQLTKCTQLTGAGDSLILIIDQAFRQIPTK